MSLVWVVIYSDMARDSLFDAAKAGRFSLANKYQSSLQSIVDRMKSTIQTSGGSMPFSNHDFIAMEVPVNVAEVLPELIAEYSELLNGLIGVGVGLDFPEASFAAEKSKKTGEIELYEPMNAKEYITKMSDSRPILNTNVTLPVNLFDPQVPDDKPYQEVINQDSPKIPKKMSLQESMQAEAQFLQAVNEMLGAGQIQQAAQQQQQAMQQQAAQQQQAEQGQQNADDHSSSDTVDLLGQLSGGEASAPTGNEGGSDQSGKKEEIKEFQSEVDEATKEASADHKEDLAQKLQAVKEQIPQIMAMADKNPDAFKQTMATIQKLISSAKQVQKSEQLEKAKPVTNGIRFPVGTRKGNYKKVLVDGQEVWRSMSSGQIQDTDGSDISVKAKNQKEKAKQQ